MDAGALFWRILLRWASLRMPLLPPLLLAATLCRAPPPPPGVNNWSKRPPQALFGDSPPCVGVSRPLASKFDIDEEN